MRQKGFTLVELLVALAVGATLIGGGVLTFHQVILGTARANSQVVALIEVHQAALSIKKDVHMAQDVNLTDGEPVPQSSLVLGWTDSTYFAPEDDRDHSITYALSGTELQRTYDGTVSIVGRHITSVGFTQNNKIVNVSITATGPSIPQRSKTLNFSIHMLTEGVQ